jgi:integral membrane sensor domain MASE1
MKANTSSYKMNVLVGWLTFLPLFRKSRVKISDRRRALLIEAFRGFLQSLKKFRDRTLKQATTASFLILSNLSFSYHPFPGGRAVAGSNPARGMDVCLLCLHVVLSCVGRGLCDGLITRPDESYRVFSVCVITKTPKGALCSKSGTKGK